MDQRDLKPAKDFAKQYGCKIIAYGGTGSGKTPIINTCPRPVLLACEPGMLSMKGSNVPTYQALNTADIDGFFKWFFNSAETKNFDTLCVDSISFMADVYLQAALSGKSASGKKLHGLAAYGEMATNVMDHLRPLYYTQQKHTYLIAKQNDEGEKKKPYFPGNVLNIEVPGLYDFILHLGIHNVPGQGQIKSFQCQETFDFMARARTGNLAEYEPPDINYIIQKAMAT